AVLLYSEQQGRREQPRAIRPVVMMARRRDGVCRHAVHALLLLLLGLPVCQPFASPNVNLRLRSCTVTGRAPNHPVGVPPLSATTDDSGENGVITGSNQLEGWKRNTVGAAADAPTRSNVMGRRRGDGSNGGDPAAAAGNTEPAPFAPRGGDGGVADGGNSADGATAWRVEAAATSAELLLSFKTALAAREPLMRKLLEEETDCYRLYHGAVEGCPGLTVDRYGTVVLVQTFRDPPADFSAEAVEEICRLASEAIHTAEAGVAPAPAAGQAMTTMPAAKEAVAFLPVWNDRRKRERRGR
ncbi:unnamed protein product, partial [Ectocarpus fasciculatus]